MLRLILAVLLLATACRPAAALGEEGFGNTPLPDANYRDWPGIMPSVNHPGRVYFTWVNGNEHFYYRGDTAALNDALRQFVAAKGEGWEVVLRPGPGEVRTFDRQQTVAFNWNLHLVGGIARHETMLDLGPLVWSPRPVLTVYTGGTIDLEKIEFPQGLRVRSVTAVKQEVRRAVRESREQTVRGWGAGVLAALDPYDSESRAVIAALLKDPVDWVRSNAVGALEFMGAEARPALPDLRAALNTPDAKLKERVEEALRVVEQAAPRPDAARDHREMLERIDRVVATLTPRSGR